MEDLSDDLDALVGEVEVSLASLEPRRGHVVADAMLHGYGTDAVTQARAVLVLAGSAVPRAAYANARSAFEAAQDMLLLATEGAEADKTAALAYAIELVETDELRARFEVADRAYGLVRDEPKATTPEEVIEEDATALDAERPGAGAELRAALGVAREPRRAKAHYSDLGRKQIGEELGKRLPDVQAFAEVGDAFYGFMSVHSHPRLRAWAEAVFAGETGGLLREKSERDSTFPIALTWVAVKLVRLALKIHSTGTDTGTVPA